MSLVWLDLETTGLDPHTDRILEVGVIITDDNFVELARYHAITNQARVVDWRRVDKYVVDMHDKSGLWGASIAHGKALSVIDAELTTLVDKHCYDGDVTHEMPPAWRKERAPQLAGNTVDFDREFAKVHLRAFSQLLHYRSLNVSSLNELARRVWPGVYDRRPNNPEPVHRVMADIEESIRVCKHYANALGDLTVVGSWD